MPADYQNSLLLYSPHHLHWHQDHLPTLKPHEVLIRTIISGISPGTELSLFNGRPLPQGSSYPIMTGYENVGIITGCGSGISRNILGQRVVASYGHRDCAVVPYDRVIPVPENIPDHHALLLILAGDAFNGVVRASTGAGQRVLITGAGMMGLLTIFNLKGRGVDVIDVVEPVAERRELALRFGASSAYDIESAARLAGNYDVAFECADSDAAFHLLQEKVREKGNICIIADGNSGRYSLLDAFHEKQLVVIGSSDEPLYREYAPWYYAQFEHGWGEKFEALPMLRVGPDSLIDLFGRLSMEEPTPLKVIVEFASRNQIIQEIAG